MWATKTAQRTSAGSVRSTRWSPWVWHMICHWNAYTELLPPSADHHYVFSQRDTDWTTHLHTHTHTHMHIDARVGGQLWCQRKHTHTHTHTHLEKCLLCCQMVGCQKEREEKENWKSAVTHRRCMAAGFSTYYNGRSTSGPFALVVPKFNDSPFM